MKPVLFFLFFLLIISGCSSLSAEKHFAVNTADFSTTSDIILCAVYGYGKNRAEEAADELRHRNFFTNKEWENIKNGQVSSGMTLCAVYAAYTNICRNYSEKTDVQGNNEKKIIYDCNDGRVPFCPFTQVTLINDKVIEVKPITIFKQ